MAAAAPAATNAAADPCAVVAASCSHHSAADGNVAAVAPTAADACGARAASCHHYSAVDGGASTIGVRVGADARIVEISCGRFQCSHSLIRRLGVDGQAAGRLHSDAFVGCQLTVVR